MRFVKLKRLYYKLRVHLKSRKKSCQNCQHDEYGGTYGFEDNVCWDDDDDCYYPHPKDGLCNNWKLSEGIKQKIRWWWII